MLSRATIACLLSTLVLSVGCGTSDGGDGASDGSTAGYRPTSEHSDGASDDHAVASATGGRTGGTGATEKGMGGTPTDASDERAERADCWDSGTGAGRPDCVGAGGMSVGTGGMSVGTGGESLGGSSGFGGTSADLGGSSGFGGAAGLGGSGGSGGSLADSGVGGASTDSGVGGASADSGVGGASTDSGVGGASTDSGVGGASTDSGVGGASTDSGVGGASTDSGVGGASADSGSGGASADSGDATDEGSTEPGRMGCADRQREGFTDVQQYPDIAGCSGAWDIPGIQGANPGTSPQCNTATYDTATPACNRVSGDDSPNPSGTGCNVQDLCAQGWHVCTGTSDVSSHSPLGCQGVTQAQDPPLFFASRQASVGCGICATGTATDCDSTSCRTGCAQTPAVSNDFFGCGNFGSPSPSTECGPLDRFSGDNCAGLPGSSWACSSSDCEAYTVIKTSSTFGGVLCCRD